MYCANGQTTEQEMFSNRKFPGNFAEISGETSQDFEEFLGILGEKVELKGFQGFLDRTVSVQGEDDRSLVALEFVLNRNSSNDQILNWITSTGPVISGSELSSYGPMFYKTALANTTRWTTIADFPNAIPPVER